MQALHAASIQQPSNGDWFMDTGTNTHVTSDEGNLPTYCSSSLHNSSDIVVCNGSTLPVLGMGSTTINSPSARFIFSNVLHDRGGVPDLSVSGDNFDLVGGDPHDPTMTSESRSANAIAEPILDSYRPCWHKISPIMKINSIAQSRTNKNLRRAILISLEGGVLNHRGQHVFVRVLV
jgi:hypothetical protein